MLIDLVKISESFRNKIRSHPIMFSVLIVLCFLFVFAIFLTWAMGIRETFQATETNELIIYIVSWIVLLTISYLAILSIREILEERAEDKLRRRANYIAIITGLVITIFLFKQSFLDKLFGGTTPDLWINALLIGGGAGGGWIVWYLREIRHYGEFFNVLLLTCVTGLCWYARLTAPEEIQMTAVAFLLGSLFRIAKDNLDQAQKSDDDFNKEFS